VYNAVNPCLLLRQGADIVAETPHRADFPMRELRTTHHADFPMRDHRTADFPMRNHRTTLCSVGSELCWFPKRDVMAAGEDDDDGGGGIRGGVSVCIISLDL